MASNPRHIETETSTNWILIGFGAVFCVFSLVTLLFGKHHVDEGYYHLIAQLTAKGSMPYRDYFYVQTPIYPLVYGTLIKLFGASLVMVRSYSLIFSLFTFLLAVRLAGKLDGKVAAGTTAVFIVCQPFTLYYLTIIKLYALSAFLIVLLLYVITSRLSPTLKYCLAAAIAGLCIGTRLTLLPTLPVVLFFAFFRAPKQTRLTTLIASLITGCLVLTAVFLPFYLISPDTFGYSVLGYHLDKEGFSLTRQVIHKIDVANRLSNLYFPLILISILAIIRLMANPFKWIRRLFTEKSDVREDGLLLLLAIALFHFVSQAPYIHRYLTMLVPGMAVLAGTELAYLWQQNVKKHQTFCALSAGVICLMFLVGFGQWETKLDQPHPIAQLRSISSEIAMLTGADDEILTFNNSIAVESQRSVLPGDEMNVLTYHPNWDQDRCELYHVLNVEMLEKALTQSRLRAVLITEYSFIGNFPTFYNPGEKGARPRIMAALTRHYHRVSTFTGFGYMGEDAELYLPLKKSMHDSMSEFESKPPVQIYMNQGFD